MLHRRWVKVVLGLVAVVVVGLVLVAVFVNADTFRPTVEAKLSDALGRKVTMSRLGFSVFSGSLVADNVVIADDSAFSTGPFLKAQSLRIGIRTGEFLFHRQLEITDFTADSPSVQLIHGQNGIWNFSSLGKTAAGRSNAQSSSSGNLSIANLKIENGTATVSSLPAEGKPLVYSKMNLTVQNVSAANSMPFRLTASLPGDGTLSLAGSAGPISVKDAADTPFQANIEIRHFNPVAAGVVEPSQGISMIADITAQASSNGAELKSTGKVQAAQLQLSRAGSPAAQPVNIDYAGSDNLDVRTGRVEDLVIHAGQVAAHVNGTYRFAGPAVMLDLKLAAPSIPVDALEQMLPAFGVKLPSGSALRGGTLTANLSITGPATAATISGPVEVNNTQLAGFDLGSKIGGLSRLGGGQPSGGGTAIQTLRAQVDSSPQLTRLSNIYGLVPQIGSATGNGTVSPSGALDFSLVAKLNSSSGVGGLASTAMGTLGGALGGAARSTAANGVPLTITGTTTNPVIRANVESILKQQAGGLLGKSAPGQKKPDPGSLLRGLLGKQ